MITGFTTHRQDPDLDRVSVALLRAGQRARELARQTATGIALNINGELRVLTQDDLDTEFEDDQPIEP